MTSLFKQSLVAQRQQSFHCIAETCVEFSPTHFTQMAGLTCYYDTRTFYYLRVAHDERLGKVLGIALVDDGRYDELGEHAMAIDDWPRVFLRARIDRDRLQFAASPDGEKWQDVGPVLDASRLSDEYGSGMHFTGAMIGLCAQDLRGTRLPADFDYFELQQ
jgi:xylan 1,4-beta-xylosidase